MMEERAASIPHVIQDKHLKQAAGYQNTALALYNQECDNYLRTFLFQLFSMNMYNAFSFKLVFSFKLCVNQQSLKYFKAATTRKAWLLL